ncbi:MAG: stage III sporulation protein AE [Firmicutes bacterium]|nr:stage III sporulation protein AE [Bacillota bacterium]
MANKLLLILMILLFLPTFAFGMEDGDTVNSQTVIKDQIDNLQIDELERIIKDINSENKHLPKMRLKDTLSSLVKGKRVFDGKEIITGILKTIFDEVINNLNLLKKLLILSIISAILINLQNAFEEDTVGKMAHFVAYIILVSIVIKSFLMGMEIGKDAIKDMVLFMQALLPILITLLVAMGGITSAALFQPIILGAISAISTIMKDIIIPLIFFSILIGIISKISDRVQINKVASLLREIAVVIIGISLTVFMGIISIQGVTASKVDGVTIRTAKFAVDNFIPIVGKFLSDAMDTVVGCSMLLKNGIGVIGVVTLFLISIMPAIKLISLIFVYKITAAVIEPISHGKIIACLNEVSKSLILVLATVLSVGLMFFIAITIIVAAGNSTVMLR